MGKLLAASAPQSPASKLKIFISYSRADTAFADELVGGLDYDGGFDVLIDRVAIQEGEPWQERLGGLILAADTIVFVLSPHSAASPICHWEVGEALRLSKRILPILIAPAPPASVPPALAALNYIRFDEGRSFIAGLTALRRALNTDLAWLREHTRLLERAQEWQRAGRVSNRMLSGSDIADAKGWLDRRPTNAPEPTELHRDYIQASSEAETDRLSAERRRADALQRAVRRTQFALVGAVLFGVAACVAGYMAFERRKAAELAQAQLGEKVAELQEKEVELTRYFKQAGEAIRKNARLSFLRTIGEHYLAQPGGGLTHSPPLLVLTDEEVVAKIGDNALQEIIKFEIGDRAEFDRHHSRPQWPGGSSGVTIGMGYDLGYYTKSEFLRDWAILPQNQLDRLATAVGVRGEVAKELAAGLSGIAISYEVGLDVLKRTTMPKYGRLLLARYPNSVHLKPNCFGALVSLVFNRGASALGERRQEMYAIRRLLEVGALKAVPEQLRAMQWLWAGRNVAGIRKRREIEAQLFEECAASDGDRLARLSPTELAEKLLVIVQRYFPADASSLDINTELASVMDHADMSYLLTAISEEYGTSSVWEYWSASVEPKDWLASSLFKLADSMLMPRRCEALRKLRADRALAVCWKKS